MRILNGVDPAIIERAAAELANALDVVSAGGRVTARGELEPPIPAIEEEPVADTSSPAAQLRDLFWKLKESRIRMNGPSLASRASSLGNECEAALFFERTVPADQRVKHKPGTQAIFDLGNFAERYVVREIEDMGCEVVQRGTPFLDRRRELSGHTDLKVRRPGWAKALTSEIKGLNPFSADSIETLEDIRNSRQAWIRKYFYQLQTYLALEAIDDDGVFHEDQLEPGLFILLNKSTGAITFIDCPPDVEVIRGLLAKAERIRDAVRANVVPKRSPSDDCGRCPFNLVCAPPISFGPGVSVLDDAALAELMAARAELEAPASEYERLDKAVKGALKKLPVAPEYLVGDFVVTRSEVDRKAYTVQSGSYAKFDIRRRAEA